MKHTFTFRDHNIISNRVGCSVHLLAYNRNKCNRYIGRQFIIFVKVNIMNITEISLKISQNNYYSQS